MQPLALLNGLAKALVRHAGNAVGLGFLGDVLVQVGEDAWEEWSRERNEQQRRAELEAVVRMAGQEFRRQVEEVVRQVAAGEPGEVRQRVSDCLEQLPEVLQRSLQRHADRSGLSVPPDLPLRRSADLVSVLSGQPPDAGPARGDDVPKVVLTAIKGKLQGQEFVFAERTMLILGKEEDCSLRLPKDSDHRIVSRHHCLLDINPPDVRLRDLGSRNGTWVNAEEIGRRPPGMSPEEARKLELPERDLKDGDQIALTNREVAVFRVSVSVPARCAECAALIPEKEKADCERSSGVYQCPACRQRAAAAARPLPVGKRTGVCVRCGRDVAGEIGADRPGDYVCAACREHLEGVVRGLLEQARAGTSDLLAIRGYTFLRELGKGGMGGVYLARHERTGLEVALKVMLPQVAAEERGVKRFLREMDNTRLVQHRHVVRLWDGDYSRGIFFMTLEYCDGGSVAGLLRQRGGTLPPDEAVEITLQALDGLHHAHTGIPGTRVVHRDLKPANLFLSGYGSGRVTKVGDFGLAKAFDDAGLSSLTCTGTKAGTPHFVPRQQVINFKYAEPAVDVWAMAASLYKMLTGRVPRNFRPGEDPWLVVLEEDPVPIRDRNSDVPEKLARVIDQALVDTPSIGFQTALEFKEALEDAL
jgi:serine/threonine-protein kinase